MRIKRLPQDPGDSGWLRVLPARDPRPALGADIKADIAIVGAGFAGLSAAQRLLELDPKLKVAVLEAKIVGEGPAGRNSGFMIDLPHALGSDDYAGAIARDRQQTAINRAAIAFATRMQEHYAMPKETLAASGKTNAAASAQGEAHNRDYAEHLAALGEPYTWLDAADMQKLTGIDYYHCGLYTPGTALLQPAMYIQALAEGIARAGVNIYEQSAVQAMQKQGDHWRLRTAQGSVSAGKVILAVNGHLEDFGHARGRLMHIHTYASMSVELSAAQVRKLGGEAHWALIPAAPMGTTVRRIHGQGGHRIVVRNTATYDPSLRVPESRLKKRIAHIQQRCFKARFAALGDVEMQYIWGGRLCLSRNAVSVVGELAPNLYSAAVQNGLGTALGTANGIRAAQLALEREDSPLPPALPEATPQRLPPQPIATLAINGYLRFKQWQCGQEF